MTTPIGPDFIALQVRDLSASRRFYLEIFGFEASAHCPPGAVILKTEPIPLALREPLRPLPEVGPLGVGMVLWIACMDADALHDLIVERGGVILSSLADGPFGRFFVAGDLDGYAITFHTARS
jgi:predicted enzyme related to lactoylglutathione lyase